MKIDKVEKGAPVIETNQPGGISGSHMSLTDSLVRQGIERGIGSAQTAAENVAAVSAEKICRSGEGRAENKSELDRGMDQSRRETAEAAGGVVARGRNIVQRGMNISLRQVQTTGQRESAQRAGKRSGNGSLGTGQSNGVFDNTGSSASGGGSGVRQRYAANQTMVKAGSAGAVKDGSEAVMKGAQQLVEKSISLGENASSAASAATAAMPPAAAVTAAHHSLKGAAQSGGRMIQTVSRGMNSMETPGKAKEMAEPRGRQREQNKKRSMISGLIRLFTARQEKTLQAVQNSQLKETLGVFGKVLSAPVWLLGIIISATVVLILIVILLVVAIAVALVSYIFLNTPWGLLQAGDLYENEMISSAFVREYEEDLREEVEMLQQGYLEDPSYSSVEIIYHYPEYGDGYELAEQVLGAYLGVYSNVPYTDGMYGITENGFENSNFVTIMEATADNLEKLKEVFGLMAYYEEMDLYYDHEGNILSQEELFPETEEPQEMLEPETDMEEESGEDMEETEETQPEYYVKRIIDVYYLLASEYMDRHYPGDEDRYMTAVAAADAFGGNGLYQVPVLSEMDEERLLQVLAAANQTGAQVVRDGLTKLGTPYSQARRNQEGYFDCSSFTAWCYAASGLVLEWGGANTAAAQARYCVENGCQVSYAALEPGDLIFWSFKENGRYMNISHVGIYAGAGYVLDTSTGRGVSYVPMYGQSEIVMCARPWSLIRE